MIKSRRMSCTGHIACIREKINAYRVLVGKSEGKEPLRRHIRRWENNMKVDFRDFRDWIYMAQAEDHWQKALLNTAVNFRVP
jgi:hypothetical protein